MDTDIKQTSPRRDFVKASMVAAAAVAATTLFKPQRAFALSPALTFADIPGTGDIQVLNFALALEELEADLYSQAMMRLTTGGTNEAGTVIPGLGLSEANPDVYYVAEFATVEAQHRHFLRSALGASAIAPFKYDFGMQNLSRYDALIVVYSAEHLGVQAYLGAIPYLTTRTYLQTAAAIQGTEARHTAVLAQTINELFGQTLAVSPPSSQNGGRDYSQTPDQVLALISGYLIAGSQGF